MITKKAMIFDRKICVHLEKKKLFTSQLKNDRKWFLYKTASKIEDGLDAVSESSVSSGRLVFVFTVEYVKDGSLQRVKVKLRRREKKE